MATGQDVRDILAIPASSSSQSQSVGQSSTQAGRSSSSQQTSRTVGASAVNKKKKPRVDGISRELYALLGDNTPSLTFATGHHLGGSGGGGGVGTGGSSSALAAVGGEDGTADGDMGGGRFMPKFRKRSQRVQKWTLAPFRNPARRDGLVLQHWVPTVEAEEARQMHAAEKAKKINNGRQDAAMMFDIDEDSNEKQQDVPRIYRFADLNTNSGVYRYSSDEYHQHLRDEDWTKEETDYLLDMCSAYDLRFVIIADRYEWPGKARAMEDLKARYYAICRRLIRSRISADDVDVRQQLLASFAFDRTRELDRKKHVLRLFSRTPAQLAEEEALYVEARRLEQNEAKFAAEREELLRLLGGWERLPNIRSDTVAAAGSGVGMAGDAAAEEEAAAARSGGKGAGATGTAGRKRKADAADTSGGEATATTGSTPSAPLSAKQKAELRSQHFDEMQNITRFDPQAAATLANSKPPYPHLSGTPSTFPPVAPANTSASASHGAYLRSTRMLMPRSNLAARTQESLAELEPPVSLRLTFPTRSNCEKWEAVVGAITSGLEMKRQLDRVQSELRIVQARAQHQQQVTTANGAPSKVGSGAGTAAARRSETPSVVSAAAAGLNTGVSTSASATSATPAAALSTFDAGVAVEGRARVIDAPSATQPSLDKAADGS